MSWSGPVAGAPPFQQPPYGNGQPGYGHQQPPYQYGQPSQHPGFGQYPPGPGPAWPAPGPSQRAPDNRPPKKKGNPIITRYPPPPGYRGPAQPQGPFGTNQFPNQYQPPQPAYPQGGSAPPTYPSQGYTAPAPHQGYPPSGYGPPQSSHYSHPYPQAQHQQWPQTGYSHAPPQPPSHGYAPPHSGYQGYPSQPPPIDTNQQAYGQPAAWPPHKGQAPFASQNHHASYNASSVPTQSTIDPDATPTPATAHLDTSQLPTLSQPTSAVSESNSGDRPQLFLGWDDWDFDFDGAIWPKSNEPVDPNLSLGVIIWHPAKQMTRALPSTFAEAEEQSLQPAPEGLDNGESVSMYFTTENSHEAFLDVRQTDDWENIKDDPVFVVFMDEEMEHNLLPLEDCVAQRDRLSEIPEDSNQDEDQEMRDANWDIMENLDQALSSTHSDSKSERLKRDESAPTQPTQEDILAKLGVTGAPKPPSAERMHPSLPVQNSKPGVTLPEKITVPQPKHADMLPALPRAQSYSGFQAVGHGLGFQRPYGSMPSSVIARPPPPPPPPEQPQYDPWNAPQSNNHGFDGSRGSPAPSEGSNRTMAGSDFGSEKPGGNEPDPSAIPSLQRSDSSFSRKRSYEDADQGGKLRQQDDFSKRKRRSQVDAAYSRR